MKYPAQRTRSVFWGDHKQDRPLAAS